MKLFFLKDHSLYKIFKTLEKAPSGKMIHIYIDPEHAFFDNERWGTQIKDLLVKKNIHAAFITKTEKAKNFFEKVGLTVIHEQQHQILKVLNLVYLFFFNIKNFHLAAYTKKNSVFYMVFGFEVAFLLLVLYTLYSLILPKTIVQISPATQVENIIYNFRYYPVGDFEYAKKTKNLSIPFHTGFIDYKYTMSISVDNIKHIQNPSEGTVVINNTTKESYTLLKWTRFETDDGLVFVSKNRFKLPPNASVELPVIASEQDNQGILIWWRWNIVKNTKMYIKNLKESFFLKRIVASAVNNFSGGTLLSQWMVWEKDIALLSGKLLKTLQDQKLNIVDRNFSLPGSVVLRFDQTTKLQVQSVVIANQARDKVPYLNGSIIARISFMYIDINDLQKQIESYLAQRAADNRKLINIDKKSLVFFDNMKTDTQWAYIIPTKISIVEWYDFDKDINGVVDDLKANIVGLDKTKAQALLYNYPEISSAKISIRPPRYSVITRLKSRISIEIQ